MFLTGLFIKDPPAIGTCIAEVLDPEAYQAKKPTDEDLKRYAMVLKTGIFVVPPSLDPPRAALWSANTPTPEMLVTPYVFEKPWVLGDFVERNGIISIMIRQVFARGTEGDFMEVLVPYMMNGVMKTIGAYEAVLSRTKHAVVASVQDPMGGFKRCLRSPSVHGPVTSAFRLHPAASVIDALPGRFSNITRKRNAKQWWNKIVDRNGKSSGVIYVGTGLQVNTQHVVTFLVESHKRIHVIQDGVTITTKLSKAYENEIPQIFPQYFKLVVQKMKVDDVDMMLRRLERSTR
jgi:hypothetical protein